MSTCEMGVCIERGKPCPDCGAGPSDNCGKWVQWADKEIPRLQAALAAAEVARDRPLTPEEIDAGAKVFMGFQWAWDAVDEATRNHWRKVFLRAYEAARAVRTGAAGSEDASHG